ncbi:methylglyoxal synthase [Methylobacterium oryzisoli]|uniref:methylglyoxal synthase n=1 Tax=Methylobacterium oryzisoli TaxID=3385502 RepID=UPI003892384E
MPPPAVDPAGAERAPRENGRSDRALTLALVAHDACKAGLVECAERHREALAAFTLVATGTTGLRVLERCPELRLRRLKSGPLGGDQQIGAMIADGTANALVFFVDPLSAMPHDVDVKALLRVALVYDIPCAMSRATADLLMQSAFFARR